MKAALRNIGILREHWRYLIMKAKSPIDGKTYFFIDKCLAFGASISCSHFQHFSNCVAFLLRKRTGRQQVNYLDNCLFAHLQKLLCDAQVGQFMELCQQINFPINMEKTFWGTMLLVFLGLLIDTVTQTVSIPLDKLQNGRHLLDSILTCKSKKITLSQLQKLCGFLNFLGRCIVPGRAFTRRLYAYTSGNLLPHHHIRINQEMRLNMEMWQ